MIKALNLSKSFKNIQALKNISFSVSSGKFIGLVGPDGAGKTTLLRLCAGLMSKSSGELEVLGFSMPNHSEKFLSNIGYMPQTFGLYGELSCYENLRLYADLKLINNPKERIDELLNFVNLYQFKDRLARNLSGGMKQKLAISATLLKKPKLLLLDEPGVGVDPIARKELFGIAKKLQTGGTTIIWATSYQDEASLCDEVIMLNEGEILLHSKPQDAINRLKGRVFLIKSSDKKADLLKFMNDSEILNASVIGDDIKLTLKKGSNFTLPKDHKLANPNFEDVFLDLAGPSKKINLNLKNSDQNSNEIRIQAINLTKKFGSFTAADNISFEVKSGEIFGLLGPNGAGKSTTFKMLCGLIRPTNGKALVLGQNIYNVKQNIGYMAQKFSLYGELSVIENLKFFAGVYLAKKGAIQSAIKNFEFEKYLNQRVNDLSLGTKQRLSLACATLHNPKVLFLDEPTSGVDTATRREFWGFITSYAKAGVSIMVTTHLMDEAEFCDNIMIIYKGKAIATNSSAKLKEISAKDTMEEAFIELIKSYD
ncbi:ATP-binding cassette domain-containing protein [Campylobacter corcagiensis]|uniref:ABC transporter ATP-binding protein n=1 Tax=Campylobacter corcagiensis TaxID=1448857 RepID=A0A7M1LHG8_9BACT|nr:ATP-binding cassette domain-containing protein [Campylobacter corcagiensis]QKF64319.1 multidrug resistance ABC transporter, ATP-binding protein [Campylobacter corcagiensis]QOQ87494.1 ABC transporter ATP-binding protein [Campylobacter corcagiensis]